MLFLLLTCLMLLIHITASEFAVTQYGSSDDQVKSVAVDSQGNILVAGFFNSLTLTIADSRSSSAATLTNDLSGTYDGFIIKYAPDGALLWAAHHGGSGDDQSVAVAVDSVDSIYIAGVSASATFAIYNSLGVNVSSLICNGGGSGYVIKMSAGGQFLWAAKQDSSQQFDYASGLSVDPSNNIIVVGYYQTSTLFIYDSVGNNVKSLANGGNYAGFVVKYDQSGSYIWAARQDGSVNEYAMKVSTDGGGSVYIACASTSSNFVVYDQAGANVKSLSNQGNSGSYLIKYSSAGAFVWATRQDGNGQEQPNDVTVDYQGNVYITGYYSSNPLLIYDQSGQVVGALSLSGTSAVFLVKYTGAGVLVWTLRLDGDNSNQAWDVAADLSGNVVVSGYFSSTKLNLYDRLGALKQQLSNGVPGTKAGFVAKYTAGGTFLWANRQDGADQDIASTIIIDSSGNTIVGGYFQSQYLTVYDSVDTAQAYLSNSGSFDGYIVKYDPFGNCSIRAASTSALNVLISSLASGQYVVQTQTGLVLDLITVSQELTTIDQTSTGSRKGITSQVALNSYVFYIIVGGIALVAIGICVCFCCCRKYRRTRRKSTLNFDTATMNTMLSNPLTEMSTMTNYTHTAEVTSHVLTVPKFLMLKFDIHFRQQKLIARGGGGSVHMCQVLDTKSIPNYDNSDLVIKNMGKPVQELSTKVRTAFYQEIAMLYLFRDSTYFAKLYGFTEEPATILLKFYEGGSLKKYIHSQVASQYIYSKRQIMVLLVQLSEGLAFMHSEQFAHCDVKPDNVLLEYHQGFLEPRITDFGISRLLDSTNLLVKAFKVSVLMGASVSYVAPEALERFNEGLYEPDPLVWKAGDTFSMGSVIKEMITKKKVWQKQ